MGQKVNPHGVRVGIIAPWSSTWYANKKDFGKNLKEGVTGTCKRAFVVYGCCYVSAMLFRKRS